jgi:hypothetical protein
LLGFDDAEDAAASAAAAAGADVVTTRATSNCADDRAEARELADAREAIPAARFANAANIASSSTDALEESPIKEGRWVLKISRGRAAGGRAGRSEGFESARVRSRDEIDA